jgi:RNA polymerase sigma-70 factor (ECF subfamily)
MDQALSLRVPDTISPTKTTFPVKLGYRPKEHIMIPELNSKQSNRLPEEDFDLLIKACIANDQLAQNQLFKIYFGYAKSICLRYSSNEEDAKDILNLGFMKVFKSLPKYENRYPFKGWLRTIMVNTALNHYRDTKKFRQEIDLDGSESVVYDENVLSQLAAEEILALVKQLPPAYRSVFMMHVVDGYTHREIAEIVGINEGTSRSNFSKARMKLQVMIQQVRPDLFVRFSQEK